MKKGTRIRLRADRYFQEVGGEGSTLLRSGEMFLLHTGEDVKRFPVIKRIHDAKLFWVTVDELSNRFITIQRPAENPMDIFIEKYL